MSVMDFQYKISVSKPQEKYIDVELVIRDLHLKDLKLVFPAWTPGSYLVRDFVAHVEDFSIADLSGKKIKFEKTAKAEWLVFTKNISSLKISYRVYANDLSVRAAYSESEFVFMNMPAVALHVAGFLNNPVSLKIQAPKNWKISTAAELKNGVYTFENIDSFYDAPVLLAKNLERQSFKVGATRFDLDVVGWHPLNLKQVTKDLEKIVSKQKTMFGDHPSKKYVFQVVFGKGLYGGLEHAHSSTNIFDGLSLVNKDRYHVFLALLSHEHFHLWNVKRIRPVALGPFDYTKENYTRELWIAEGITSYYDDHFVFRAGCIDRVEYLKIVADNLNRLELTPGRLVNSLSDSSFDAWTRFYRPNENSHNRSVSYYLKGGLVMMRLDFLIIKSTKGQRTLDDVMRALYRDYKKDPSRGVTAEEFFASVKRVAPKLDVKRFEATDIDGVADADWQSEFLSFGIDCKKSLISNDLQFGWHLKESGTKVVIEKSDDGSAVHASDLQPGDELVAINGCRVDSLKSYDSIPKASKVDVIYARRGLVKSTTLDPVKNQNHKWMLGVRKKLLATQKKYLNVFLRTK